MIRDQSIIGQKFTTNSGDIVTIIDGENKENLTIQFEDGSIRKNITYGHLKRGKVAHPSKLHKFIKEYIINETFTTNSGDIVTIIDGKNKEHLTIQFKDGTIRKNIRYDHLKNGKVAHSSKLSKSIKDHIGETFTLKSGYKTTIIDGNNVEHLIIQFEDGITKNNVYYNCLKKGEVAHPYLTSQSKQFHSIKLNHKYCQNKQTLASYDCTCEICGKNMLLTPVGLMRHHLTCQKETQNHDS